MTRNCIELPVRASATIELGDFLVIDGHSAAVARFDWPEAEEFYCPDLRMTRTPKEQAKALREGYVLVSATASAQAWLMWPLDAPDCVEINEKYFVDVPDLLKVFPWPMTKIASCQRRGTVVYRRNKDVTPT